MFKRKLIGSERIAALTSSFKRIAQELKESIEETKEEINYNKDRVEEQEKLLETLKKETKVENAYLEGLIADAKKYVGVFDGTVAQ